MAGHSARKAVGAEGDRMIGTTLMFRNVPRKYTSWDMLTEVDRFVTRGDYDYVYVPWGQRSTTNMSYCFVNFRDEATTRMALDKMRGSPWKTPRNARGMHIVPAQVQGLRENLKAFLDKVPDPPPVVFKDGEEISMELALSLVGLRGPRTPAAEAAPQRQCSSAWCKDFDEPDNVCGVTDHCEMLLKNIDGLLQPLRSDRDRHASQRAQAMYDLKYHAGVGQGAGLAARFHDVDCAQRGCRAPDTAWMLDRRRHTHRASANVPAPEHSKKIHDQGFACNVGPAPGLTTGYREMTSTTNAFVGVAPAAKNLAEVEQPPMKPVNAQTRFPCVAQGMSYCPSVPVSRVMASTQHTTKVAEIPGLAKSRLEMVAMLRQLQAKFSAA